MTLNSSRIKKRREEFEKGENVYYLAREVLSMDTRYSLVVEVSLICPVAGVRDKNARTERHHDRSQSPARYNNKNLVLMYEQYIQ